MNARSTQLAQFIVDVLDKDSGYELCHLDATDLNAVEVDGRIDLVRLANRIEAEYYDDDDDDAIGGYDEGPRVFIRQNADGTWPQRCTEYDVTWIGEAQGSHPPISADYARNGDRFVDATFSSL